MMHEYDVTVFSPRYVQREWKTRVRAFSAADARDQIAVKLGTTDERVVAITPVEELAALAPRAPAWFVDEALSSLSKPEPK